MKEPCAARTAQRPGASLQVGGVLMIKGGHGGRSSSLLPRPLTQSCALSSEICLGALN